MGPFLFFLHSLEYPVFQFGTPQQSLETKLSFFLLLTRLCSIILFLLLYFGGDSGRPDV